MPAQYSIEAILIDVNLSGTVLTGANFEGADLSGVRSHWRRCRDTLTSGKANLDGVTIFVETEVRSGNRNDDNTMFRDAPD